MWDEWVRTEARDGGHGAGGDDAAAALACLQALHRSLGLPLPVPADGLHFQLDGGIAVSVVAGRDDGIALLAEIARVADLELEVLLRALRRAAAWGVAGETLRLVVIEEALCLLWTTPVPADVQGFVEQVLDVLDRAVGVAALGEPHA
jgi:hypothetical protein